MKVYPITLTESEWDLVEDALAIAAAEADEKAAMWVGRSRAEKYKRECDEYLSVLDIIRHSNKDELSRMGSGG
jgi:hypothetical protein